LGVRRIRRGWWRRRRLGRGLRDVNIMGRSAIRMGWECKRLLCGWLVRLITEQKSYFI